MFGNSFYTPLVFTLKASLYGNLCTSAPSLAALGISGTSSALLSLAQTVSQPMYNVSNASVPSVRCSRSVLSPQATKAASR